MFTITLYNNTSPDIKIGKTLQNATNLTGTIKGDCTMQAPTVLIEYNGTPLFNYCYIPEFSRYYFITNVTSVRSGLWSVSMSVDVLESFASDIRNSYGIIDKQENTSQSNLYINDGSYVTQSKEFHDVINFSNGFLDEGEYILITCGGSTSV